MVRVFRNRTEAGIALASRLEHLRGDDIVVLGLPRGGVPVAFEIAQAREVLVDTRLIFRADHLLSSFALSITPVSTLLRTIVSTMTA